MRGGLPKALFEREMTRKEFLQFIGGSIVVLLGLAHFTRLLQQTSRPKTAAAPQVQRRHGFGSRKFGV